MSIRNLRARLERLQARAGARYVIGQHQDRDRKRREELVRLKLNPGLTNAQTAEMAKLGAFYEIKDGDRRRGRELFSNNLFPPGRSCAHRRGTERACRITGPLSA